MNIKLAAVCAAMAAAATAQSTFHAESTSSIRMVGAGDDRKIEVHNVRYQYTGSRIPGRPEDERLALRITTHANDFLGDIPEPGAVTIEAWILGGDLRKPVYTIKTGGSDAQTLDDAIWVVNRGYVDMSMWSIYKLGSGQHLFDTYVDLLRFSITKDIQTMRYAGLEVPPDDTPDARLKERHVVAVLRYASEDRVIRALLLTHTNPARARELRSYEDTERTLSFLHSPSKRIRITFGTATEVMVPLKGDDLDATAARLPAGMRLAPFNAAGK